MKKILITLSFFGAIGIFTACNSNSEQNGTTQKQEETTTAPTTTENGNPSYDPERGSGKFT